jgi:uncharacterized membrane protein
MSVPLGPFHLRALLGCVVYVRDSPLACGDMVAKASLFCFIAAAAAAAPSCPPASAPLAKRCFRRRLRQRKNTSAPMIARRKTAPPTAPPITAPDGPSDEAVLASMVSGLATSMSLFRAPKYSSWSGRSITVGSSLPTGQVELFWHGSALQQPQYVLPAVQVQKPVSPPQVPPGERV